MKRLGLAVFAATVFAGAAHADNLVDCSVLSGTPYVCVRNSRPNSVTGISCTGFWGESPVSLPGGNIPSNGMTIVKMPSKCQNKIQVKTRDGHVFTIEGFDVNANTVLNISND